VRTLRAVVAVLLAFGVVVTVAPVAAADVRCADLTVLTLEYRQALGFIDGQCVPKASGQTDVEAIQSYVATPGDLRELRVVPTVLPQTMTLTGAAASTVATTAGKAVLGVGSSIGSTIAAGVTLAVGGLLDWFWKPDTAAPTLPAPVGSAGWDLSGTAGRYNFSYNAYVPNGLNGSVSWTTGASLYNGTRTTAAAQTWSVAANVTPPSGAAIKTQVLDNAACVGTASVATTSFKTCYLQAFGHSIELAGIVSGNTCAANTVCTINLNMPASHPKFAFLTVGYQPSSSMDVRYLGPAVYQDTTAGLPTDPFPGRTIEQTVSCKRPDGTSYTYTNSADASMALSAASLVPVAGLMCDTGDRATGTTATLKSPGKDDVAITDTAANPSTLSTVPQMTPETLPACAATAEGCTVAPSSTEPAPPIVTEPAPPITSPGVDTPTGTDFCSFSFGDVLNGAIMFKAVGCALSWAFVPAPNVLAVEVAEAQASWTGSRVGTFVAPVMEFPGQFASWGDAEPDCSGPKFTIPLGSFSQEVEPMNACEEPMATVAFWIKLALTAFLVWAGITMVINPILLAMGLNVLPSVTGVSDGSDGEMPGQGRMF